MSIKWDPKHGAKPSGWADFSEAAKKALLELYSNKESESAKRLRVREDLLDIKSLSNIWQELRDDVTAGLADMSASGQFWAKDGAMSQGLSEIAREMKAMFDDSASGIKVFRSLSKELKGFSLLADGTNEKLRKFTTQIALNASALEKLGLSASTSTAALDKAVFTFSQGTEGVENMTRALGNMASKLKESPETITRNFTLMSKSIKYDMTETIQQLEKFQKVSQISGVKTDALASSFSSNLDTKQGASAMAANLNQILGTNKFSGTQIMMNDPAQREEMISKAIKESGRFKQTMATGSQIEKNLVRRAIDKMIGIENYTRNRIESGDIKREIKKQQTQAGNTPERFTAGTPMSEQVKGVVRRTQVDVKGQLALAQMEKVVRDPKKSGIPLIRAADETRSVFKILGIEFDKDGIGASGGKLLLRLDPANSNDFADFVNAGLITDTDTRPLKVAIKAYAKDPSDENRNKVLNLVRNVTAAARKKLADKGKEYSLSKGVTAAKMGDNLALQLRFLAGRNAGTPAKIKTAQENATLIDQISALRVKQSTDKTELERAAARKKADALTVKLLGTTSKDQVSAPTAINVPAPPAPMGAPENKTTTFSFDFGPLIGKFNLNVNNADKNRSDAFFEGLSGALLGIEPLTSKE
jgi:hypothetical protein